MVTQVAQFIPSLCMVLGSQLDSEWGDGTTIGRVASRSKAPCSWVVELAKALANAPLGQQERDHFLEAMGHTATVPWPMERAGHKQESFLCFPGLILVSGVDWTRCFLIMTK